METPPDGFEHSTGCLKEPECNPWEALQYLAVVALVLWV